MANKQFKQNLKIIGTCNFLFLELFTRFRSTQHITPLKKIHNMYSMHSFLFSDVTTYRSNNSSYLQYILSSQQLTLQNCSTGKCLSLQVPTYLPTHFIKSSQVGRQVLYLSTSTNLSTYVTYLSVSGRQIRTTPRLALQKYCTTVVHGQALVIISGVGGIRSVRSHLLTSYLHRYKTTRIIEKIP